jgi:putative serine protease PepD
MSTPVGLGEPARGPRFVSDALRQAQPGPPTSADRHGAQPSAAAGPTRRAVLRTAVLTLLAGSVGGGITGLVVAPDPAPVVSDARLPRSSGGPVIGDLSDVAGRVLPSVVSVQVRRGIRVATGSGFVVDGRGHVVTNAHVVGTAAEAVLRLDDGRQVRADVIGRDIGVDIAVLRAPEIGVPPLLLGRSADVEVGDQVLAVGSPLRLSGTVTAGIVSAVNREVTLGRGGRQTVVQTDTPINPGNSGGPLVNARGEVIGVNTAIASLGTPGNIGIGFAIPIDRAAQVVERLIGS